MSLHPMLGSEEALTHARFLTIQGKQTGGLRPLASFLQVVGVLPASLSRLTDPTLVLWLGET